MWIQLLTVKQIEEAGVRKTYYPGDWVDIGKQTARQWIASKEARTLESDIALAATDLPAAVEDIGIVVTGDSEKSRQMLAGVDGKIPIQYGRAEALYPRTMIWDPEVNLRAELVPVGLQLLKTWEIAIPQWEYSTLANGIGTPEEQAATEKAIRDLRVPVYDTRLIFVRQCENVKRLLDTWLNDKETGFDSRLAFLKALYQVKPFILALPCTWINPNYGG
jgi:hypothetical protein